MNKSSSIEYQFVSKWQQAEDLPIPNVVDQSTEKFLLDAFDKHHCNTASSQSKSGNTWFYAIAASLLIAIVSWQFLFQEQLSNEGLSQSNTMLVSAINESKQLEATFEQLKHQPLSEFIYVQKFQLEKELLSINSKLIEAYHNQDNLQEKLQLWQQKNQTLSQLNVLIEKADSIHATHI